MSKIEPELIALKIDRNRLDDEIEDHPLRVYKAGQAYSAARMEYEGAEAKLSAAKRESYSENRRNWEEYSETYFGEGGVRLSEEKIKMMVEDDDDVQYEKRLVEKKQVEYNRTFGILEALRTKSNLLHSMVLLHGQSYFAVRTDTPRESRKRRK